MNEELREELPIPEALRSRAWKKAKQAALDEWSKGSADTTQMLMAASRAVDAALVVALSDCGPVDFHAVLSKRAKQVES